MAGGLTKIYLHENLTYEYFDTRILPDLRYACRVLTTVKLTAIYYGILPFEKGYMSELITMYLVILQ